MAEKVEYELSLKDLLSSKIKDAENSVQHFEGSMGNLQGAIMKIGGAIGVAFAVNKIIDFGKEVINAGTMVENATTGLTTLLGSTAQATQVVKNTMEDATKTPFAFEGLLQANKALISAGVNAEDARKDVLNLGNAIAATGGTDVELQRMVVNLQQIKNTGKATALDIKQFAYAGVNIYKVLAEATHQPIEKVKDMEVSYDMLTMALAKAHEKGGIYYNGLENMANNTSVKISNVGDAMFQFMNDIFIATKPLTDAVLQGTMSFITDLKTQFNSIDFSKIVENLMIAIKQIQNFLQPLVTPFVHLFTVIKDGIMKIVANLMQFKEQGGSVLTFIRDALGGLINFVAILYEKVYSFIAGVIDVLHTIYVFLDKIGAIWLIGKAFEAIWWVIQKIGEGIVWIYDHTLKPIFDAIGWAYKQIKDLLGIKDAKIDINLTKKTETNPVEDATKKIAQPKAKPTGGGEAPSTKGETSKVTGQKNVTINVSIGKLIETFKVQTTNMQEGSAKVRELVAQTLLSAVNDSQITAGI